MKTVMKCGLVALLALPVAGQAQWRTEDTLRQVAVTATLLADYSQTRQIAKHPERWVELNPLLGQHPSPARVRNYFAAVIVGSAVLAYTIPQEYRSQVQWGQIVLEGVVITRNRELGLKFKF